MDRKQVIAVLVVCAGGGQAALAQEPPTAAASRGELLYNVNCVSCHGAQMHWREKKLAVDWPSLKFQVNRWQTLAGLGWSKADVAEVARFLDQRYYHYPGESGAD